MTTIVGDWRRKILVSDSQYSDTDVGIKYFHEKVYRIGDSWFGGAGHAADIEKVVAFLSGKVKKKPKLANDNSFVWLRPDGMFNTDSKLDWETCDSFIALGTGAMAAEALLRHGETAEVAVFGACSVDLYSCDPIIVYELGSDTGRIVHRGEENAIKLT